MERVSCECRLIRREVIESVGLRNEGSRPLLEGLDQSSAARRAGLGVLYVPSARIVRRGTGRARKATPPQQGDLPAAGQRLSPVVPAALMGPPAGPPAVSDDPHAEPLPRGTRNMNPPEISFVNLLREDFRTHGHDLLAPGFWAVALHRFGNLRMDFPRPLRVPATVVYRTGSRALDLLCGIDLSYTVKLGRRVRIWYHGGMRLGARAIGSDVHIRHNTTFGLVSRNERTKVVLCRM